MKKALESRLARLEAQVRVEKEVNYSDRPYTLEKDWSREEKQLVISCLRSGSPVPPELVEKMHLTKISDRLVGLSKEEREEVMRQIREADDDPNDDLERFREEVTG